MARAEGRTLFKPIIGGGGALAYTAASAVSAAAPDGTVAVFVLASTDAYLIIGDGTKAASNTEFPLPLGVPITLAAAPGDKLNAIRKTADGSVFFCWMN